MVRQCKLFHFVKNKRRNALCIYICIIIGGPSSTSSLCMRLDGTLIALTAGVGKLRPGCHMLAVKLLMWPAEHEEKI